MDLIQVLGQKDVRIEAQLNDENAAGQLLVKNKFAGDVPAETFVGQKNSKRFPRGMSNTAIKHFINRKDCPVRNHFIGLPKWRREDAVKAFDTYLWSQHQKNAIEKSVKDWFNARVKELMSGHNIDLVDDIDFVKSEDASHGYTLKNYIEYLAKEI